MLFLVYGMRLRTGEVWAGLTNYRLQISVFVCTFLLFSLAGWGISFLPAGLLGTSFSLGLLYLTLLPSTVQSSVSFTSLAGGNVAGAVFAATISNIAGMVLTPALVWFYIGASSGIQASSVGLPMAAIIFPPPIVAAVTIPVIVFHQI